MKITGTTAIVATLGTPIAQVESPGLFNAWFEREGADLAMIPIDVDADRLDACFALIRGWANLRGVVVTVPHKQRAAEQADSLTPRAALLGAANVIRRDADGRLYGDMTDGPGFLKATEARGFDPRGARALVVGAGGAGSAIAHALCEAGAARLTLLDESETRVQALARRLRAGFAGSVDLDFACDELGAFDLLVNATPVGMAGDARMPLAATLLRTLTKKTLVADVVTSPALTPLLRFAGEIGCRVQTGPEMAAAQFELLARALGVMAPGDATVSFAVAHRAGDSRP